MGQPLARRHLHYGKRMIGAFHLAWREAGDDPHWNPFGQRCGQPKTRLCFRAGDLRIWHPLLRREFHDLFAVRRKDHAGPVCHKLSHERREFRGKDDGAMILQAGGTPARDPVLRGNHHVCPGMEWVRHETANRIDEFAVRRPALHHLRKDKRLARGRACDVPTGMPVPRRDRPLCCGIVRALQSARFLQLGLRFQRRKVRRQ